MRKSRARPAALLVRAEGGGRRAEGGGRAWRKRVRSLPVPFSTRRAGPGILPGPVDRPVARPLRARPDEGRVFRTSQPPPGPEPTDIPGDPLVSDPSVPLTEHANLQAFPGSKRPTAASLKTVVSPVRFRPSPSRGCGASSACGIGRSRAPHASLPVDRPVESDETAAPCLFEAR